MAAPIGNKNAANAKVWRSAIERALEARGAGDRLAALNVLAEKLLEKCDEGDLGALRELGDRIEGKPGQAIDIGSDPERPFIQRLVREIVRPSHKDG